MAEVSLFLKTALPLPLLLDEDDGDDDDDDGGGDGGGGGDGDDGRKRNPAGFAFHNEEMSASSGKISKSKNGFEVPRMAANGLSG